MKRRRRFAFSWFFIRYYNTFLFLLVTLAGVREWWLAGALLSLGLAFDLYRRATSPELKNGQDGLINFHSWADRHKEEFEPRIKKYFWLYIFVWVLGLIYVILIVNLSDYIPERSYYQYFQLTGWLVTAGKYFFPLIQEHMTAMQSMDMQFRAAVVGHIYAFSGFFFIVTTVFFSFRYLFHFLLWIKYAGEKQVQRMLPEQDLEEFLTADRVKFGWKVFLILPTGIFIYLTCMALKFDFDEGVANRFFNVTEWNIGISDRPIFVYLIFMWMVSFLINVCYSMAYLFVCEHKKLNMKLLRE